MFERKESFWKKRGFYLSACAAILCVLTIGTMYYKINYPKNNDTNLFADSATEAPNTATSDVTGGTAINKSADNSNSEDAVSVAQNNTPESSASTEPASTSDSVSNSNATDEQDTDSDSQKDSAQKKYTAEINKSDNTKKEIVPASSSKIDKTKNSTVLAKNQDSAKQDKNSDDDKNSSVESKNETDKVTTTMKKSGVKNTFDVEKGLLWPVTGDVILKYSMSNTVYFKTLAQYKCNPAIIIASKEGTEVKAAANGTVTKVAKSDEVGNLVTVDIGNGYLVTYGQLDNISVKEGQPIKEGSTIGKIAKPTKYYSEEGSNLYLQVMENDKPVDPMLLLR